MSKFYNTEAQEEHILYLFLSSSSFFNFSLAFLRSVGVGLGLRDLGEGDKEELLLLRLLLRLSVGEGLLRRLKAGERLLRLRGVPERLLRLPNTEWETDLLHLLDHISIRKLVQVNEIWKSILFLLSFPHAKLLGVAKLIKSLNWARSSVASIHF